MTDTPDSTDRPSPLARLRGKVAAWVGEKGSMRRTLARNSAWETSGFVLQAVVMFFLMPFVVAHLGDSRYGIWEIVMALTGFLNFADLGMRPAAVHFIARYDAQKDYDALNRYVNTAFVTFATAGLVIIAAAVPLSFVLPRFWQIAQGFETEASIALLLVAAQMAISLPLNAFSAVLVGKQRYDRLGRIRIATFILYAGLVVLVLSKGLGLVALAAVVAGTGVLRMILFAVSAFRLEKHLRFAPRLATKEAFGGLIRFGGWAMVVIFAMQVIWATDALVIGRAISDVAVTWFAIGFKLAFYVRELMRVAVRVVEPAIGALHGLGDKDGIRDLLTKSARVMLLFTGPIVAYLLAVGEPFIRTWQHDPVYAETSSGVLVIMTIAVIPAIASAPLGASYYGTNRVRPLALFVLLEAALNLGFSIALVGPYGIEGVAIGTAIPAWLVHAVLIPWHVCRLHGVSFASFLLRTWSGPVIAGLATLAVLTWIVDRDATLSWLVLFLLAALSVIIYGAVALVLRKLMPWLMGSGPLLRVEAPVEREDDAR